MDNTIKKVASALILAYGAKEAERLLQNLAFMFANDEERTKEKRV